MVASFESHPGDCYDNLSSLGLDQQTAFPGAPTPKGYVWCEQDHTIVLVPPLRAKVPSAPRGFFTSLFKLCTAGAPVCLSQLSL